MMTSIRTTAACLAASICEIGQFPQVTVPVMDVIDDAVIYGTDEEYRAAMVAKWGENWENLDELV